MTRIEFWSAVMGLLVAIVVMFNQMNGRIDALNDRMGREQAETHGRFDTLQAETIRRSDQAQAETVRRFDQAQVETNRRFDQAQAETNNRFDQAQAENNQRFDAILEAIGSFDRRVSRNEGQIEVIREQLQAEGAP